ncbi:hypothetical protein ACIHIX_17660 [Streptomyces sp. NPDC051913]|uniref:hypothetical protein n=1 Tax=Streptomyces sp. NPDC051913 TaxID=3365676 RepID=UPI0037D44BC6
MDTHAHDRRRVLALGAALAAGAEGDQADFFPDLLQADQWSLKAGAPLGRGDPVRPTVRPENLLLFEADRPQRPGRRIGKR